MFQILGKGVQTRIQLLLDWGSDAENGRIETRPP